jgi:catalase (peroxidase I)
MTLEFMEIKTFGLDGGRMGIWEREDDIYQASLIHLLLNQMPIDKPSTDLHGVTDPPKNSNNY